VGGGNGGEGLEKENLEELGVDFARDLGNWKTYIATNDLLPNIKLYNIKKGM